jgi:hypothetical protein
VLEYLIFIDKFNKNLIDKKVTTVKMIEELFTKTLETEKLKNEYMKDHFDSTVITCSWVDIEENRKKFCVGLLNKEHFGNRLVELKNNQITILYPFDYLEDHTRVENFEKRFNIYTVYNGNFGTLLHYLLLIFAEISSTSFGVSRICDIGIQVYLDSVLYKFQLKEDVHPLIEAAKEGTILNLLSVVN